MSTRLEPKAPGTGQPAAATQSQANLCPEELKRIVDGFLASELAALLNAAKAAEANTTRLFTRQQLAERWNCCPHTVARRKDLKPVRFNKRMVRYRLEDVLAVEAAATV